jgi:hypothetical protein
MARERTLDEALDEIDRWSAKLVAEIENLSPEETAKYFQERAKPSQTAPKSKPKPKRKRKPVAGR